MKQIIFLYCDSNGVNRMTKNLSHTKRGEIPVKLTLTVDPKAFREPIVEKEVVIEDWREGVDISDVDFKKTFITPDEANAIREMRAKEMVKSLQALGYEVSKKQEGEKK